MIYQITNKHTFMTNFTLKFGKYKGQMFFSTPASYQSWLLVQDWFKAPNQPSQVQQAAKQISQLSNQLAGWDGHSKRGAAIYDAMFDAEVALAQAVEAERKYFGMNAETKQAEMQYEYDEIRAEMALDEYYEKTYGQNYRG